MLHRQAQIWSRKEVKLQPVIFLKCVARIQLGPEIMVSCWASFRNWLVPKYGMGRLANKWRHHRATRRGIVSGFWLTFASFLAMTLARSPRSASCKAVRRAAGWKPRTCSFVIDSSSSPEAGRKRWCGGNGAHAMMLKRQFGEPGTRRSNLALTEFGRDASIGRDQRKLALERLLGEIANGAADSPGAAAISSAVIRPSARRAVAHRNCSSTNHFLSLSEHFLVRGARDVWAAGWGKVHWPKPPQLPFCNAENFRSRRRFNFLAVTA